MRGLRGDVNELDDRALTLFNKLHNRCLSLCLWGVLLLAGCAGRPYISDDISSASFLARTMTQEQGEIRVSAAVPDASETAELFRLSLYKKGVQPVWIEVENSSANMIRLSIWSVDSDYYSPLEVAWMNRGGYSKEGRSAMERSLYDAAIDRRVPPGEKRSGFVFTHLTPGTKGFNVDLISTELRSYTFTFFVPMPGFTADYMAVDFANLYADDEVADLDTDTLRAALERGPCCATDESGALQAAPFNLVMIGTGVAVSRALLRADWQETELDSTTTALARTQHYMGRRPDGTFVKIRPDGSERKELRLWLAPMRVGQELVWLGQTATIVIDRVGAPGPPLISPDIDTAFMYLMQNIWYSQSLRSVGFVRVTDPVPPDAPVETLTGWRYYTTGLRGILWLSEEPVGLDEVSHLDWESIPSD